MPYKNKPTTSRENSCEFTELLDRAISQLESLLQAKTKGITPTRLRITTKPVVVRSEDEALKIKWAQTFRQCELLPIEVLLNHSEKVIKETRSTLRDISGDTYKAFKKVNAKTAKANIKDALKTTNNERKQRTENRKKRKLEAAPSRLAKQSRDNLTLTAV